MHFYSLLNQKGELPKLAASFSPLVRKDIQCRIILENCFYFLSIWHIQRASATRGMIYFPVALPLTLFTGKVSSERIVLRLSGNVSQHSLILIASRFGNRSDSLTNCSWYPSISLGIVSLLRFYFSCQNKFFHCSKL